jgi:glyoxylase-like metal-dependent hydrolase (beta-lactamase superfamily II)
MAKRMAPTKSETTFVRQLPLGSMKNFVTLLGGPRGDELVVVDPAWDADAIIAACAAEGRRAVAIMLTHHHHDHLNAVEPLLEAFDVPVYVQRAELAFAPEAFAGFRAAVRTVEPDEVLQVAGLTMTCLHTPGHTPGSQCLWCGSALVSGDTLFVGACGRCDLPGGSSGQLFDSLHRVLARVPDEVELLPGHDYGDVPRTTLGRERSRNPYLLERDREGFIALRSRPRKA